MGAAGRDGGVAAGRWASERAPPATAVAATTLASTTADRCFNRSLPRTAAGHANAAARDLSGAARHAAYAAGQAAAVGHVAAHELGAAAYAIQAAWAAATWHDRVQAGRFECRWQRAQLPNEIRELVLDDQQLRNELCWFAFDC